MTLNAALFEFAPRYMKDQLENLAYECDQRLERELLPRLRTILRQVDQERDAFEKHKQDATRDLRKHLSLLRFDAAAVDDAIGRLHTVAPRYLALFPKESSLALPFSDCPSASASLSTPSTTVSADNIFDTPCVCTGGQVATSPVSTPDTSNHGTQVSTTQAKPRTHPTKPLSLDCQVQAQVVAESSTASPSPKRPQADRRAESGTPYKRQRTTEDKASGVVQLKIKQRVAFPNLMTGVDGEEMASKYWIREHLGMEPHTFVPETPANSNPQVDNTGDIMLRDEDMDDFCPSFPKLRDSIRSRQSDHEENRGKLRRGRRNVPRLDYAEIAAPWSASEVDTEVNLISRTRGVELT
ncbi:hypothetical protein GQX73_g10571 [Xylaria multiplex]|uniref:Uncharacterized protein n=1 Tax=Xylaria multiplex TaxID=323545 RepID=A0A7C8IK20_9PEZI|nr:hypothetical protein GQX73_g10571 [Xylaria multiplex]